ncbi:hypothetical protein RHSIM_Rhsim13G0193400 [Rhododendron simsii]|uniref:Uncharacterized protein n=1 Tax=Rhododendron simsii TaxID=118357 RepID=A0A834L5D8_RHOSS|nr:hypothetical protein RHSIM_Rhsim13G0193400 [Rhododendron simsii]
MGGDMRYEIGQNAYIKLVLQALNHKTSAVNGLLLGRLSAYNNDVIEITESRGDCEEIIRGSTYAVDFSIGFYTCGSSPWIFRLLEMLASST